MSNEEVIKFIKLFREEWDRNSKTKNALALDIAIKALEKQIPKKPEDVKQFRSSDYQIGLCPSCRGGVNSEFQYCGDCGQKLDWR